MPDVKHIKITATLEAELRSGVYPEKLPPVRVLARCFQVSLQTMTKALRPLTQAGLLDPGPGGTRVTALARKRKNSGIVAVVTAAEGALPPDEDPLLVSLRDAAQADGYEIVLIRTTGKEIFKQLKFWDADFCDGFIFVYSTMYELLFRHLHVKRIPFISANWLPDDANAHWIDFDNVQALFQTVEQLVAHGYRRIAYLFRENWAPGLKRNAEIWSNICESFELYNYSRDGATFTMAMPLVIQTLFDAAEPPPEVLIAANASVPQLLVELDKRQLKPVIATQTRPPHLPDNRYFARSNYDYTLLGPAAWRLFMLVKNQKAGAPRGHHVHTSAPTSPSAVGGNPQEPPQNTIRRAYE